MTKTEARILLRDCGAPNERDGGQYESFKSATSTAARKLRKYVVAATLSSSSFRPSSLR